MEVAKEDPGTLLPLRHANRGVCSNPSSRTVHDDVRYRFTLVDYDKQFS
jgi:hypothetical protein